MRYAVLGVGRQGLAVVYDLLKHCQATEIRALDARFTDGPSRAAVARRLQELVGSQAALVQWTGLDLAEAGAAKHTARLVAGVDCLISALPYSWNERATQIAIEAAVPMCDMGGNPGTVEKQRTLAERDGHVVVPECGLAPGIANVFIKHLHQSHGCGVIKAYCGGLPAEPPDPLVNPLQYKLLFSPAGLVSEYMGDCPVLRRRQVVREPALGGLERFDELHEAFYTSNISPRILEYFAAQGVTSCEYRTLRYHGHCAKFLALRSLGFLQGGDNTDAELADRLGRSAALRFDRSSDHDKVNLCVQGQGSGGAASVELIDYLDEATRFTAMERTTSWGTTIIAHALATGVARPSGFATPEQLVDPQWFLEQLRRRTDRVVVRTQPGK